MEHPERTDTSTLLLILCDKRQVQTILEEFEDWNNKEGIDLTVLLYGITQKAHEGFILLALNQPLPEGVYTNLVLDQDIVDYVQYTLPAPKAQQPR